MQGRRTWVRLHEKGGNRHELPCHRELETFLLDYIEDAVRLGWSYNDCRALRRAEQGLGGYASREIHAARGLHRW